MLATLVGNGAAWSVATLPAIKVNSHRFQRLVKVAVVQVFGCRHDDAIHALRRPASEKRQGTKSREVGHRRCRGRYGELAAVRDLSAE